MVLGTDGRGAILESKKRPVPPPFVVMPLRLTILEQIIMRVPTKPAIAEPSISRTAPNSDERKLATSISQFSGMWRRIEASLLDEEDQERKFSTSYRMVAWLGGDRWRRRFRSSENPSVPSQPVVQKRKASDLSWEDCRTWSSECPVRLSLMLWNYCHRRLGNDVAGHHGDMVSGRPNHRRDHVRSPVPIVTCGGKMA